MLPHLDYPIPEVQLLPSIICHITKRNCFSSCNILFLFKTDLITVGIRIQDARSDLNTGLFIRFSDHRT